jgi:cholesterol transport system auxiliary component
MMARVPRRTVRLVALMTLMPVLSACGGLLPSPPERTLYRLNPTVAFTAPLPHSSAQLLIATPTAPAALDTRRIALVPTPLSLDYYAGSEWADRVPFLVQTALVQAFEKSGAIRAAGPEDMGLRADFVLETAVRDFAAVYDSPKRAPHVRIGLAATLIKMPGRDAVAQTSFTTEAPAAANSVPAAVVAFDTALGTAVRDLVRWTLRNPALSRHRAAVISRTRFVRGKGEGSGELARARG